MNVTSISSMQGPVQSVHCTVYCNLFTCKFTTSKKQHLIHERYHCCWTNVLQFQQKHMMPDSKKCIEYIAECKRMKSSHVLLPYTCDPVHVTHPGNDLVNVCLQQGISLVCHNQSQPIVYLCSWLELHDPSLRFLQLQISGWVQGIQSL